MRIIPIGEMIAADIQDANLSQPLDDVRDRLRLGAIGAQEFQPCGRGKEEIAQGDDGATIQRQYEASRARRWVDYSDHQIGAICCNGCHPIHLNAIAAYDGDAACRQL